MCTGPHCPLEVLWAAGPAQPPTVTGWCPDSTSIYLEPRSFKGGSSIPAHSWGSSSLALFHGLGEFPPKQAELDKEIKGLSLRENLHLD